MKITLTKLVAILLLLCTIITENLAQQLSVYTGASNFRYFDLTDDPAHELSFYSSSTNVFFGVGLDDNQTFGTPFKITLQYERTSVEAFANNDFFGPRNEVDATTTKSFLSMGVYPWSVQRIDAIKFDFGIFGSMKIGETVSGIRSRRVGTTTIETDLQDEEEAFNSSYALGIALRPEFDWPIGPNLWLTLHYAMNINVLNEFRDFPKPTKTIRHFFGIGLKTQL